MQKKSQSAEDNENAALVLDMLETLDANLLKVGHNTKSCLNWLVRKNKKLNISLIQMLLLLYE